MSATKAYQLIEDLPKEHRGGSLAFFGAWFGGIADNCHFLKRASVNSEELELEFDNGELLKIWNPTKLEVLHDALVIWEADKVEWHWNLYGITPSDRHYYRFEKTNAGVVETHSYKYAMVPKEKAPAVEMAWFISSSRHKAPYDRFRSV